MSFVPSPSKDNDCETIEEILSDLLGLAPESLPSRLVRELEIKKLPEFLDFCRRVSAAPASLPPLVERLDRNGQRVTRHVRPSQDQADLLGAFARAYASLEHRHQNWGFPGHFDVFDVDFEQIVESVGPILLCRVRDEPIVVQEWSEPLPELEKSAPQLKITEPPQLPDSIGPTASPKAPPPEPTVPVVRGEFGAGPTTGVCARTDEKVPMTGDKGVAAKLRRYSLLLDTSLILIHTLRLDALKACYKCVKSMYTVESACRPLLQPPRPERTPKSATFWTPPILPRITPHLLQIRTSGLHRRLRKVLVAENAATRHEVDCCYRVTDGKATIGTRVSSFPEQLVGQNSTSRFCHPFPSEYTKFVYSAFCSAARLLCIRVYHSGLLCTSKLQLTQSVYSAFSSTTLCMAGNRTLCIPTRDFTRAQNVYRRLTRTLRSNSIKLVASCENGAVVAAVGLKSTLPVVLPHENCLVVPLKATPGARSTEGLQLTEKIATQAEVGGQFWMVFLKHGEPLEDPRKKSNWLIDFNYIDYVYSQLSSFLPPRPVALLGQAVSENFKIF